MILEVVHYGNYAEVDGCHYIIENTAWHSVKKYRIKPDSVAQLIGLDKNGNEVYEGDTIKHKRGAYFAVGVDEISKTTAATFKHYAGILSGEIVKVA